MNQSLTRCTDNMNNTGNTGDRRLYGYQENTRGPGPIGAPGSDACTFTFSLSLRVTDDL